MANELKTKKITDLEENTTIDDTDILMAGDKGTNALKRFTVAKLFDAIKTKIAGWAFDTLTTTDKTLPGAVNELNSKLLDEEYKLAGEGVRYRLKNGYITVVGTSTTMNLPANTYTTVGTLPAGYRPKVTIPFFVDAGGGTTLMLGKILVTGEIQVFSKTETSYWNLNAVFPI